MPPARPATIGSSMLAVAVLEVTSVRKMVTSAMTITKTSQCVPVRKSSRPPIHSVSPESWNPCASAKPPPKRISTSQGTETADCQSSNRLLLWSPAGIMKSASAPAMAMVESSS